ncbi:unnamed protein product [Lota lota]
MFLKVFNYDSNPSSRPHEGVTHRKSRRREHEPDPNLTRSDPNQTRAEPDPNLTRSDPNQTRTRPKPNQTRPETDIRNQISTMGSTHLYQNNSTCSHVDK